MNTLGKKVLFYILFFSPVLFLSLIDKFNFRYVFYIMIPLWSIGVARVFAKEKSIDSVLSEMFGKKALLNVIFFQFVALIVVFLICWFIE